MTSSDGHEPQDLSAERVARNDARFRESNERLEAMAETVGFDEDDDLLPFLCECADMRCTKVLQLTRGEYEKVRRSPVQFLTAYGHERGASDWARVVDEFDRYTVVEKVGRAAEVAAELDMREANGR
jgi:hypothetical protein